MESSRRPVARRHGCALMHIVLRHDPDASGAATARVLTHVERCHELDTVAFHKLRRGFVLWPNFSSWGVMKCSTTPLPIYLGATQSVRIAAPEDHCAMFTDASTAMSFARRVRRAYRRGCLRRWLQAVPFAERSGWIRSAISNGIYSKPDRRAPNKLRLCVIASTP